MFTYDGEIDKFLRCYGWEDLKRGHGVRLFKGPTYGTEQSLFYVRRDSRGRWFLTWHIYNVRRYVSHSVLSVRLRPEDDLARFDPRVSAESSIRSMAFARLQEALRDKLREPWTSHRSHNRLEDLKLILEANQRSLAA